MKRKVDLGTSEYAKKKRVKNVFSLKSFGHSLAQPSLACAKAPRKRKWYASTDEPLRYWTTNYRDAYLRVLVTREGPLKQEQDTCSCGLNPRKYRCHECHGIEMLCKDCMVESHRICPLCRIEAWNGDFFEPRELRQLGLTVQLGHPDNQLCPRAHRGRNKFVVIAPNGFHHVTLDYCQCRRSGALPWWEQLLLYGWFPSTPDHPKGAITIPTLKLFHAVSLQGKTTVYHFFNALAKLTDNSGSRAFGRHYQLVLCVVRQWRNLRALKRGGMGNDPDRTASETREAELAVKCIACPKAGVNLPDGWRDAPFFYMLFLAIDACFRLKRKKLSSWTADPSLQDGWAYFVRSGPYFEFVKTLGEQKEMSTCTGLAALDHANAKYLQGYAATGCGMVTCGHHEVVTKNGVADLQAGEKYGNMDYVVASAWRHFISLLFFLLSYDIMCQWSKKLKERLKNLPPALRLQLALFFVKFVIPKLHILGHLKICQEMFSLLFTPGSGQADMEGIERIWSSSGLMGVSTREMGPGSRQDTLDDFWHYWNWNKVIAMGDILRTRFLKARKELVTQKATLDVFSQAQKADVPAWQKAVDDFEAGVPDCKNPYELPKSGITLREIELELLREEQANERKSGVVRGVAEATMTEYLMLGLEIEGQQRQLSADLGSNRSPSTKDLADFVTRWTRISQQIRKLRELQRKFSPAALQRLATQSDPLDSPEAECAPLFLPSSLSPAGCMPPGSATGLAEAEARLRDAHLVDNQQRKVDLAVATYWCACDACLALVHVAGASDWKPLEKADLRMPEDEEEAKRRNQRAMKGKRKRAAELNENNEVRGVPGMGEKTRLISWIWVTVGHGDGIVGKEIHTAVKVEWCKAYARSETMAGGVPSPARGDGTDMGYACYRSVLHQEDKVWADTPPRCYGIRGKASRLATQFRRLWWHLSDRIAGPGAPESSASLGVDEQDIELGNDGSDGDEDNTNVLHEPGALEGREGAEVDQVGATDEENHSTHDSEDEEGSAASAEDAALSRVEMDELLALQTATATQYDEI
ncbi:CxC2 domain-containing protein [Mycena sanguinolenta]|uniref:CxC2 domain-containing protein n=1 Tax=Mycena sanguinolenta TaxID=230812 RepID=A0A8H6XU94_9AGAR|nr:CxC2 domain-containing protein [Mycena sanguinolenta]